MCPNLAARREESRGSRGGLGFFAGVTLPSPGLEPRAILWTGTQAPRRCEWCPDRPADVSLEVGLDRAGIERVRVDAVLAPARRRLVRRLGRDDDRDRRPGRRR